MQSNATLLSLSKTRITAFLLLCLLAGLSAGAQLVAFPGAEGAGRFTSGGRGTTAAPTTVYAVTNLNDDNNPGSLRYALSQNVSSRTVVFRVAGTIRLASPLSIKANTTIAGQTAPGGGICVSDYPVSLGGDNIIVRYMRFRLGDRNQAARAGGDDAFGGTGRKNIIIDHCTMSWSDDEALTIYGGDSTTIQWNFITEPLNLSYHDEGSGPEQHGYGGIQGGRKTSIHHNLFAHCYSRTPRFDGVRNISPNTPGLENVDFVNNVIYNWGTNNVYGGEGGNYNLINNYYKYGPSTNSGVRFRIANPYKQTTAPVIPYGKYYIAGNYVDGSPTNTANNWRGVTMDSGNAADTALAKVTTPFSVGVITTQDATTAYNMVLLSAGATLPLRDTLDQRIVSDVTNRTGRIIDVQGGYPRLTPFATSQTAWPALAYGTAPADSDGDGMPDSYETSNGLNPADASDRQGIASNGYTNLENYINSVTTAPALSVSGNLGGFAQTVGSPSAYKTYTVTGSNLTGDVAVSAPANFQVSANSSTWSSTLNLPVSSGTISSSVYVRMNATAAGSYSGTISNTSSGITQNISADGIAATAPAGVTVTVAKDGTGNYMTVQAAIDAYPTTGTLPSAAAPYVIFIKNGRYREKINIPSNKPFIQLIGESVANTILYYDDPATVLGTQNSASFTVNAPDFFAMNITFANTFGDGSQAVALLVNNDRAVFKNCRFLGNQDTVYLKGSGTPRHYFNKCYIDGNVDFIFGSSIAVFDSCTIYAKTRSTSGNSYITAANTPAGQSYGFVFRNSRIANNTGGTLYYLGRPWQNTSGTTPLPFNRTTFLNTTMGASIAPEGWSTWDATTNTANIDYSEYASKDFAGAPVNTASRVSWSQQLTATQAASYTNAALFSGWDPCAVNAAACTSQAPDIAVSNFRATRSSSNAILDWNISWNMTGITYEVYRSTSRTGGYSVINSVTSTNDTAYNFRYSEALPSTGTAYYYYVVASRAGFASHSTDTVSVSNVQTIVVTSSLSPFIQNIGTPSAPQTITVSGTNLTDDITITPPAKYEVSANGINWYNSTTPLVIPQTAGTVANTFVSVRLNSPTLGTWAGNVVLSSQGATDVQVPVTGTTSIIAPVNMTVLQWWPMTQNANDSAAVRSVGVTASTPTFNKLYLSNGTTVAVVPPYSPARGQAFGTTANGDGSWGTASGGPGSTLNRTFYEQFTVTAATGYSVRVDSILVTSAFYNTNSGTKLAVVWSKSGFASDSADVTTTPGTFSNPILLANQTTGPTNTYNLAVNGSTGVTLAPGQTLTFRMYFSCGSSSTGRYAMVKDVIVKGMSSDISIPTPTVGTNPTSLPAFSQVLGLPSAAQTYKVKATNLTSPLLVRPPLNYEVSANGSTWFTNTTPLVLYPVSGTVDSTLIYVRLNAAAVGTYSGNVQDTTAAGANANVAVTGTTAAIPTIVANSAMTSFSQTLGAPSATQTYTIAGYNLTANLTVTPPANYEISNDGGNTWYSSSNPLTLTPVSGLVPTTTITVRLNAPASASYSGNIVHVSSGAATVNVAVSGITSGTPTLITSGSLNAFSQTIGAPSALQTYTISGSALTGPVTITPPAGYEVSADGSTWFTASGPLVLNPTAGTLATTTISVRLNAATPGTYSGNIVNASTGATSVNVPVNGVAVPAPLFTATASLSNFTQTVGTPSAVQTYTVSGTNLVGNVTITPPAGYEVSVNGTNWFTSSSPLVLTPVSGTIATTTISVRLNAATAGNFSGNITHTGTGFTTVNVPVNGTSVLPPTLTVTPATLPQFVQTQGAPSASQQFTVSGQNLTANVIVTAPAGYELSLNGTTWTSGPLTIPASGTLAATPVSVRLNAAAPGAYAGTITIASTGAATKTVTIAGVVPTLSVTGTLQPFQQILGTPSAPQSYLLTGSGLVGSVTIAPPARYQVSLDSGRTWSSVPVTVAPVNGTVNTQVYVRLNSGFTGTFGYTITHRASSVGTVFVDVIGNTTTGSSGAYSIYPIPAFNVIWFGHPASDKEATITIFSMSGQRLATYRAQRGAVETQIRIHTMAQGLYLAVYDDGTERITRRFIKK